MIIMTISCSAVINYLVYGVKYLIRNDKVNYDLVKGSTSLNIIYELSEQNEVPVLSHEIF